ncbi:MTAP family purine nucleoside phosphorylase [Patescibacteria group bacterium]|nr:MTAP family purine nucleoside phosphorylase [Patescibacteria group bacterium]
MENKNKIGIIGGGNLYHLGFLDKEKIKSINTPYGEVFYFLLKNTPLILRHGLKRNIPPHKINYMANIYAFKDLGVKNIYAFNSVGSLKKRFKPGIFLIPDDYINFDVMSFCEQKCKYIVPGLSLEIRNRFISICQNLDLKFQRKGIYFQTKGPRFETKAEINLIKNYADVVGMTMAKEATLAKEIGLEYATLCSLDNYAHGIIKQPLTQEMVEQNEKKINIKVKKIVQEIIKIATPIH